MGQTKRGDGEFELVESAGEEVVAGGDPDQLLGAPEAVVEGLELGAGAERVARALNEDAQTAAADGVLEIAIDGGKAGGDDAGRAGVAKRSGEGDDGAGSETESGQGAGQGRVTAAELGEAGAGILDLAGTAVVEALAEVDAAEIEAQDGATGGAQAARQAMDDLVVEGAAMERMGMAQQRGFEGRDGGQLEQSLETAGGAGDEERFDAEGQKGLGGTQLVR
jgi:hypothetical protein